MITLDPSTFIMAPSITIEPASAAQFQSVYLRGLTHKLNNMLAAFRGFSDLLLMSDELDESSRECAEQIRLATGKLGQVIDQIIPAGGAVTVNNQPLALNSFLRLNEGDFQSHFSKGSATLVSQHADGLPNISADTSRLKTLLGELLKNAAQSLQKTGGSATFTTQIAADGGVDFIIENAGEIMANKYAEIFTPFVTTRDGSYLGLGLTVAANLAHAMNMTLGIRSQEGTITAWLHAPAA
jgi:C4-dicarboxylate-specific signal transduction histidine kinase